VAVGSIIGSASQFDRLATKVARVIAHPSGAQDLTSESLQRIRAMDDRLNCMVHVDESGALDRAAELDAMQRAGKSPLPLHGVPIVVKEIYSVDGMPDSAGSALPTPGLFEPEGPFIRQLRDAGCVILGKSLSTEFAFGQYNLARPMPVNPCDIRATRVIGGSSSGSAGAQAAGYCGFALGTDTGGSVRAPAAMCGVTGFKPSTGHWSMQGIVPLSRSLDSPGLLTNTVADAAFIFGALGGRAVTVDLRAENLRLGVPRKLFFDDLEAEVAAAMQITMAKIKAAGVELVPIEFPDLHIVDEYFATVLPTELIKIIGKDCLRKNWKLLDPLTSHRLESADAAARFDSGALENLQHKVEKILRAEDLDAWISPTVPCTAIRQSGLHNVELLVQWQKYASRNTRSINVMKMAACTLPVPAAQRGGLPTGLQLAGPMGSDAQVLSIGMGIEGILRS